MDLGLALLIVVIAPFVTLAAVVFAILSIFKRARKFAFPAMAFVIGYGFGNLIGREQWADAMLRFAWAKPYIEAPVHSLAWAILFTAIAFLLLTVRTKVVFRGLLALSLVLICLPGLFVAMAYVMAKGISDPKLLTAQGFIALLASLLVTVLLGVYCLRNPSHFQWVRHTSSPFPAASERLNS